MTETPQAKEAPTLERRSDEDTNQYRRSIFSMEVTVSVVIGSARLKISDMLKLKKDGLISLSSKIDDPVELCAEGRVIARGELIEMEEIPGQLGLKLTEIVDINDAMED